MSGEMPAEFDQPMDEMHMDDDMHHDDMDYDMDGMKGEKGMMDKMMMGGEESLMFMIGMTMITYGLKLTRWIDADKYTSYTLDVANWELANTINVYGEFVLSTVAVLIHVGAMFVEEPMLKEAFMITLMLTHVVFMVSNILRMVSIDAAYAVLNDAAQITSHSEARSIISAIQLEMAMTTAHEAMEGLAMMKAMGGKRGGRDSDESDSMESDGWEGDDMEGPEDDMVEM